MIVAGGAPIIPPLPVDGKPTAAPVAGAAATAVTTDAGGEGFAALFAALLAGTSVPEQQQSPVGGATVDEVPAATGDEDDQHETGSDIVAVPVAVMLPTAPPIREIPRALGIVDAVATDGDGAAIPTQAVVATANRAAMTASDATPPQSAASMPAAPIDAFASLKQALLGAVAEATKPASAIATEPVEAMRAPDTDAAATSRPVVEVIAAAPTVAPSRAPQPAVAPAPLAPQAATDAMPLPNEVPSVATADEGPTTAAPLAAAASAKPHAQDDSETAAGDDQGDRGKEAPVTSEQIGRTAAAPTIERRASVPAPREVVAAAPSEPAAPTPGQARIVTMTFDAPDGSVGRLRVSVVGDAVHATILAEPHSVSALEQGLPELRRTLSSRGFGESHLTVRAMGAEAVAAPVPAGRPDGAAAEHSGRDRGDVPRDGADRGHEHQRQRRRDPGQEHSR